jgi:hypothetical protein
MSNETNWESVIAKQIQESVGAAVRARLTQGYGDSPLHKLIDKIVLAKAPQLEALLASAADSAFASADFKKELNDAFNHKLARVLVSRFEGEIEKRTCELRADPKMRARITLAIERAISEAAA